MNEIRRQLHLAAPVQRVWAFLTDPQKLSMWLMDSDLSPTPGTNFKFTSPPAGRWDGKIYCEIQDIIENERISYTWSANDIGVTTLVTFDLERTPEGTRLTLTHAGFKDAAGGSIGRHAAGWAGCFKALHDTVVGKSPDYDWSELQVTYFVDAPIEEVYPLWATADGMTRFWADEVTAVNNDGDKKPGDAEYTNGDRIHLLFPTQSDTEIEILNIERNKFVLFSFGEGYGWVSVSFSTEESTEDQRTRIVLRQFGMSDDLKTRWEIHAHARGWWIANLMNIQSVLVHGFDLRVREPSSASGLGTLYQRDNKTTTQPHDWSVFDVYLYMEAAPRDVLRYWQTSKGITQFFVAEMSASDDNCAEVSVSALAAGSRYNWRGIHDYSGEGQFLQVSEESVEFTFGRHYHVAVSVTPVGSGTLLHLRQSGIGEDNSEQIHGTLNCRSCWIYYLVNLKSVVESGNDLRDQNPATADAVSVGFNLLLDDLPVNSTG
jgi:uncharacterized protein YndB with AHSA1/START domain